MVFGMLPGALGVGEVRERVLLWGISVIGELLTSLSVALMLFRSAYDIFDDWQEKFKNRKRKKKKQVGKNKMLTLREGTV